MYTGRGFAEKTPRNVNLRLAYFQNETILSHMRENSLKQTQIEDAAFSLLARNASASLSDIAAHAQVGRATLHRYFPSRDDLMQALINRAMSELEDAVDEATQDATDYFDALRLTMTALVPLANRALFLSQDPSGASAETRAQYEDARAQTEQMIDAAKAEGSLVSAMPTPWIAELFDALAYAAWTLVGRQEATPKQAEAFAWQSFARAITQKGLP